MNSLDDLKGQKVRIRVMGETSIGCGKLPPIGTYIIKWINRERFFVSGKASGAHYICGFCDAVLDIALEDGTLIYENPAVENAYKDGSSLSPAEKDTLAAQGVWHVKTSE